MKKKILEFENAKKWMSCLSNKNQVPDWYKKMPVSNPNPKILPTPLTIKSCSPFLDAFLTGYLLTTPVEFAVQQTLDGANITWVDGSIEYIKHRNAEEHAPYLPIPSNHSPTHFMWQTQVALRAPSGHSLLLTHPLNRHDLPFTTLSAVIDADSIMQNGSVPFFLKNDFEGLIPTGTPFAQVLPFKRENWKAQETKGLFELGVIKGQKSVSTTGDYKKNFWHKKSYE